MANQSDRIHNAIHAFVAGYAFPQVTYDTDTGVRTTLGTSETAKTVLVREVGSTFMEAPGYRREPRILERDQWTWEALVAFDGQVSVEEMEQQILDDEPTLFLPRTAELDQQVTIQLVETFQELPPEQQASAGTRATFRFVAHLSRR